MVHIKTCCLLIRAPLGAGLTMRVSHIVSLWLVFLCCFGLAFVGTTGSYVTVPGVGSYKLHKEPRTYNIAARKCQEEDAHLAVVNSKEEEDVLIDLFKRNSISSAYVGVNDIAIEGFMVTVLGDLWSSVGYSKWGPGEPNDVNRAEDCVSLLKESMLLNDRNCNDFNSFFCERNKPTNLPSNKGPAFGITFSDGYLTVPDVGNYRLHVEQAPYSEAAQVCESEDAHLAVINSKEEEDVVMNLLQSTDQSHAYVGINDMAEEGTMVTVLGERLATVGYYKWTVKEPNNAGGAEDCAVIGKNRLMNDVRCGKRISFFCEKYTASSSKSARTGGYVTVPGIGSYILHEYGLSYNLAAQVCENEGSHLAVINTKAEEDLLVDLLSGSLRYTAYVGVNDIVTEGNMATVLGESWSRVGCSKWAPGEPNDADNREDCVTVGKNRLLKDVKCDMKVPFFCEKKTTETASSNRSTIYNGIVSGDLAVPGESIYTILSTFGSYKLHPESKTYSEALRVCISEGAHLAIINSKAEKKALVDLFSGTLRTEAYIGINDIAVEGEFVTVFGEPFLRDGFYTWAAGEPRHSNGLEDCVVLRHDQTVAVRECGERSGFICEKANGCPAILVDPSTVIQCDLNKAVVDCAEKAKPGTSAIMTCAQGYAHESGLKFFSANCQTNNTWSDRFTKCERDCGESNAPRGQAYVSGGRSVRAGALPWHVGIFNMVNGTYQQLCGGTLVTPYLVVTAAHCFWNADTESAFDKTLFRVSTGQISISWDRPEWDTQKREVAELILPDRFTGSVNFYQSDIALVRLSHRVDISRTVNVICVDWRNRLASIEEGENGTVAGWGFNENKTRSENLMAAQLAYLPFKQCWDMFKNNPSFRPYITSDKLCAGWTGRGTSVCPGDSGGGLVFPKATKMGNRYYLRGIVSVGPTSLAGKKCNADNVAAFTDISAHLPFLKQHVKP